MWHFHEFFYIFYFTAQLALPLCTLCGDRGSQGSMMCVDCSNSLARSWRPRWVFGCVTSLHLKSDLRHSHVMQLAPRKVWQPLVAWSRVAPVQLTVWRYHVPLYTLLKAPTQEFPREGSQTVCSFAGAPLQSKQTETNNQFSFLSAWISMPVTSLRQQQVRTSEKGDCFITWLLKLPSSVSRHHLGKVTDVTSHITWLFLSASALKDVHYDVRLAPVASSSGKRGGGGIWVCAFSKTRQPPPHP